MERPGDEAAPTETTLHTAPAVEPSESPPTPAEEELIDTPVSEAVADEAVGDEAAPTEIDAYTPPAVEPAEAPPDQGSNDDSDSFPSSFTDRASA